MAPEDDETRPDPAPGEPDATPTAVHPTRSSGGTDDAPTPAAGPTGSPATDASGTEASRADGDTSPAAPDTGTPAAGDASETEASPAESGTTPTASDGVDAGATAVHPTAGAATTTVTTATPTEGGTQRYDVPRTAAAPWQPGTAGPAAPPTPAAPWGPAPYQGPGTGPMPPVPPGAAAAPAFGTPPATGGTGPWGPPTGPFAGAPGAYGQYGGYGPGPTGPFWGPPPPGAPGAPPSGRPYRRVLWIGVAAAVVLVLLVATVVLVTRPSSPAATVEAVSADMGGWEGVAYSGRVADRAGGQAALTMTVDRSGNATGILTRDGGGRADFVLSGTEQAIRGDQAWWQRSAAASRPELVERLAGVWLTDARSALPDGLATWGLSPGELAGRLSPAGLREQDAVVVDGQEARVFTSGAADETRLTVRDDDPPALVAMDLPGFGTGRAGPATVARADPQVLGTVPGLVAQLPTMKSWFTALTERPQLAISVEGSGEVCNSPTCTVTVRLVNSGTIGTSGTIVVTLNDAEVARHPFRSDPGSNLTFPTTAANPVYSTPGARITALWNARVEGGR
ncbi:hypothetical protein ACR9E3_23680 [Actinomycetospora sp. C-140]